MFAFLDLTDHDTGKRLLLRFDDAMHVELKDIREHPKDGTQLTFSGGRQYWVRESIEQVAEAVGTEMSKIQSREQSKRMARNMGNGAVLR